MELRQQQDNSVNNITAYDDQSISINGTVYHHSVYFSSEGDIHPWDIRSARDITFEHLLQISGASEKQKNPFEFLDDSSDSATRSLTGGPEIMLIGTGQKQLLLPDSLLLPFFQARIGIECMQTHAAARTFNVLVTEGRDVAVALIID